MTKREREESSGDESRKRSREEEETESEEPQPQQVRAANVIFPLAIDLEFETTEDEPINEDEDDISMTEGPDDRVDELLDRIFRPMFMPLPLRLIFEHVAQAASQSPPIQQFTALQYTMATRYVQTYINIDASFVSPNVLNLVLTHYVDSGNDEFPAWDDLLSSAEFRQCGCRSVYGAALIREIYTWSMRCSDYCFLPSCAEVDAMVEFNTLSGRWPSIAELSEYTARQAQFFQDPVQYHQRDRQHTPFIHVDGLPMIRNQPGFTCAICHDEISAEQEAIVLQPCNHRYHNSPESCLGEGSIRTWLAEHNFCPLCKTKVELQ
jgi:hypothetical protein